MSTLTGVGIGRGLAVGPILRMPEPLPEPADEPSTVGGETGSCPCTAESESMPLSAT